MKTVLATVVAVLVLTGILFWIAPWSKDYAGQQVTDVDHAFRDQVRDDRIGEKADQELKQAEQKLREQYALVAENREKLAGLQEALADKQKVLEVNSAAIRKAYEWLRGHRDSDIVILAGRQYTFSQTLADANQRKQWNQALATEIEALTQSASMLEQGIKNAEATIKSSLQTIQTKRGEIETKKVLLASLRTVEMTKALVNGMNQEGTALDVSTRYLNELDRRVVKARASVAFDQEIAPSGSVPWNEAESQTGSVEALGEYLADLPQPIAASGPVLDLDW